jgi:hypothetical protein
MPKLQIDTLNRLTRIHINHLKVGIQRYARFIVGDVCTDQLARDPFLVSETPARDFTAPVCVVRVCACIYKTSSPVLCTAQQGMFGSATPLPP